MEKLEHVYYIMIVIHPYNLDDGLNTTLYHNDKVKETPLKIWESSPTKYKYSHENIPNFASLKPLNKLNVDDTDIFLWASC